MMRTARGVGEEQFVSAIIEMAQWYGWRIVHFRPARTARGWRTAVQGDGVGFPDLLMLRNEKGLMAECKSAKGVLTPEQAEWLRAAGTAGFETYVWRPQDWDEIEDVLR